MNEKEMRSLFVTKSNFKELVNSHEGEQGYLFLYLPPDQTEAYSVSLLKRPSDLGIEQFEKIDERVFLFVFVTPDIRVVPYLNLKSDDDSASYFMKAISIYKTTEGHCSLYLEIKNKNLKFYSVVNLNGGFASESTEFKLIDNSFLLKHEERIREILLRIERLKEL